MAAIEVVITAPSVLSVPVALRLSVLSDLDDARLLRSLALPARLLCLAGSRQQHDRRDGDQRQRYDPLHGFQPVHGMPRFLGSTSRPRRVAPRFRARRARTLESLLQRYLGARLLPCSIAQRDQPDGDDARDPERATRRLGQAMCLLLGPAAFDREQAEMA